jgi:hypothetical protein
MDRAEVRALVEARRVQSPDSVQDPLGLALELLRPDSVSRALAGVDRRGLIALRMLAVNSDAEVDRDSSDLLRLRGLVGRDEHTGGIVPLPEVGDALERALGERTLDPEPWRIAPRSADTSRWFGEALSSVRRGAALLRVIATHPPRLSRKGAVTTAGVRALAEAIHSEPQHTEHLLSVLRSAGLLEAVNVGRPGTDTQALAVTARATEWLGRTYPERWLDLAVALAAELPSHLRRALEIADPDLELAADEVLGHEYPLLPEALHEAAAAYAAAAATIGLTAHGLLCPAAAPLLAGDLDAALAAAIRDMPAPATGVYVQPDLTVIVPGPLLPEDEQALSEITDAEQLGAAAVLRVSSASLTRGLQRGGTTAQIRALLQRLSLTGVPQPLDFVLTDLDRAVWPARRPPADAVELSGEPAHRIVHSPTPRQPRNGRDTTAALDALADRVAAAARAASGAGDLGRRLELAIRDRTPVVVTAAAGNDERTFTLLPLALTGGRLRATDQVAGVERTLPLSAIVTVSPAPT